MMRGQRKLGIAVLLVGSVLILGVWLNPFGRFLLAGFMERGTIVVEGVVVDEAGQPLDDVRVRVMRSVLGMPFQSSQPEFVAEETIDGRFRYEVRRAFGVSLQFQKDGYYDGQESTDRGDRRVRAGQPVDMRIVLDFKGKPTTLAKVSASLEHRAGTADGQIMTLHLPEPGRLKRRPAVEVTSIADAYLTIPHGISMLASVTNEGQVDLVEATAPAGGTWRVPARTELRMHNARDGFIRADVGDSNEAVRHLRQLRVAPEDGYERTLVLDPDDLVRVVSFYFRTQGLYGKGQVSGTGTTWQIDDVARISIRIWLQPDGSRNVAGE